MAPLDRIPIAMLASPTHFESREAVEAANPVALGSNMISVREGRDIVFYLRQLGATDLIGGDGSEWQEGSTTTADFVAVVGDILSLLNLVPSDQGSFLPELRWFNGGGSFSYNQRVGRWYRLGNEVTVEGALDVMMTSLGSGVLQMRGLDPSLRPMPGDLPGYLEVKAKNELFTLPQMAAELNLSWTPGSPHAVFGYFSAGGYYNLGIDVVTGTPAGNMLPVSWTGGGAKIEGWEPGAVAGTGRIKLVDRFGAPPTGTLTGAGWTATLAGPQYNGAPSGETFLDNANFDVGQRIAFAFRGTWRIA